ncbi:MFS transporter [Streptomyces griseoincarnatus]
MSSRTQSSRHGGIVAVLLLAQLMATMDNSIVAVATATIERDLDTSGAMIQLVMAGYTLAFAAVVITGARLGDEYGHRRVFSIGLVGFTCASLLCGVVPDAGSLVAARLLQGGFGALMVPQVLSLIQILLSGPARARAISLYSLVLALGVAFGQIIGGVLVNADLFGLSWRTIFLVNVPIGVALAGVVLLAMPRGEEAERTRLDLVGSGVLLLTMSAVVAPLSLGRDAGWPVWTWIALAAGAVGCVYFVRHEKALQARGGQPLLDLNVLKPRGVAAGLLACCILNFAYAGTIFTLTLHLQTGLDYSSLRAGLTFLPYPVGFATASLLWTRLPESVKRALPTVGITAFAAGGAGLILVVRDGWPTVPGIVLLLICGASHAAAFSPLVDQAAEAAGPRFASAISALVSTGTLFASALSVSAIGGVYLSMRAAGHSSAVSFSTGFAVVVVLLAVAVLCAWQVRQAAGTAQQVRAVEPETGQPTSAT